MIYNFLLVRNRNYKKCINYSLRKEEHRIHVELSTINNNACSIKCFKKL